MSEASETGMPTSSTHDRFRRCRIAVALVLAFCALYSPLARAQAKPDRASKPAQDEIVVDVVVTDESHQPVKGLRQQDFQIFEGNKKQKIRSFEAHESRSAPELPKPSLPANTFTNANSFPPDSISVILLDQLNTSIEDQRLAHQRVIDFLSQKPSGAAFAIFTLRNDEVACAHTQPHWTFGPWGRTADLVVPSTDWDCSSLGRLALVQGITTDKDRLVGALNSDLARPRSTELKERLSVLGSGIGASGRYHAFSPVSGWIFGGGALSEPQAPAPLDHYGTALLDVYNTSMSPLAELGHFLQNLPGRKSLLWMSDNFDAAPIALDSQIWFPPKFQGWEKTDLFSPVQMVHLTAGRLAVARVAIYPADLNGKSRDVTVKHTCPAPIRAPGAAGLPVPGTVGLTPISMAITAEPSRYSCDDHSLNLGYMASQSGGEGFHGEDKIEEAIARSVSDQSNYYSLAYSRANTKFDGNVRNIKITIAGRDYHLAYRKRYFADDPTTLNRPETAASPDIYLRSPHGQFLWNPVRVSDLNPAQWDESREPIVSAMRYGAPESNDVIFSAHVAPTDKLVKATPEQMDHLGEYESFRTERIQNAMEHLTKEQKKKHKGRTVLETLPAPDPIFLQPYAIDYSIAGRQLSLTREANGDHAFHLEVAILAYDVLGKRVAGLKDDISETISASELPQFQSSDYQIHDTIQIPDRATLLRLAIRDVSGNRIGSLEIPVWAISSPYRRKQLELPPAVEGTSPNPQSISQSTQPN